VRLDRLCDIFITSPLVPQRLDLIAYHPDERLDRKHLRPQSGQLAKRPLSTNSLFKRVGFVLERLSYPDSQFVLVDSPPRATVRRDREDS
jgi:hypothetical protein